MLDPMAQLADLDDELNKAEVKQGAGDDFPDGSYMWAVEKGELVTVKNGPNAGKPQVEWWLRVIEGPSGTVNRIVFHYHRLYGPDEEKRQAALTRFKTDLDRVGYRITSFRELPAILQAMVDDRQLIRGSLKTGSAAIQNCYFNAAAR